MDYNDLNKKLNSLKVEELVWIIYIGIIIYSFYSNSLEKKYFLTGNKEIQKKYRQTLIIIFSILIIIYFYFLNDSYNSLQELKITDSNNKKKLVYLSFLASLFIFLSGVIFLYIAYSDESLDVEIAFN